MKVEPQKEHAWLQRLVGDWTYEIDAIMAPGEPPIKLRGNEIVRSVGGIWIVADGQGEMPGGGIAKTMLTIGFNQRKQRFVGSWIGSMMTYLWMYEGTLDASEKVLSLECDGPVFGPDGSMSEGTTRYKDVHALISENERTLTGNILGPDGNWSEMMTCTYRRS